MAIGEQYRRLSGILEKYKVSMVFTSGIHGYFREERQGIPYIITGGGGSELASADSFFNYIIVEVEGDKAKDKMIKLTMPPLGWYDQIVLQIRLYAKNTFETHPLRSIVLVIIIILLMAVFARAIQRRLFRRTKKSRVIF